MKTIRRFTVGVLLAAGLAATGLAAVPASADVLEHQQLPVEGPLYNACTGEVVDLSGNVDWLMTSTVDSSGAVHVAVQTNFAGVSGIGETTGIRYEGTGHGGSVLTFNPPFPQEYTNSSMQQLISQGSAPDMVFVFKSHLTINADGSVTASDWKFVSAC
jgi:hypothetical protein